MINRNGQPTVEAEPFTDLSERPGAFMRSPESGIKPKKLDDFDLTSLVGAAGVTLSRTRRTTPEDLPDQLFAMTPDFSSRPGAMQEAFMRGEEEATDVLPLDPYMEKFRAAAVYDSPEGLLGGVASYESAEGIEAIPFISRTHLLNFTSVAHNIIAIEQNLRANYKSPPAGLTETAALLRDNVSQASVQALRATVALAMPSSEEAWHDRLVVDPEEFPSARVYEFPRLSEDFAVKAARL